MKIVMMRLLDRDKIQYWFSVAYEAVASDRHSAVRTIESMVAQMVSPSIECIKINTQDHHDLKSVITLKEAQSHGCQDSGFSSIMESLSELLEGFLCKLPTYLNHIAPDTSDGAMASALQAETEIVAYCSCCGLRLHYQYDFQSGRIDIAAHQQHRLAEYGRDAGCQYEADDQLSIELATPSRGIVITKDIRNILDENTPRLISDYLRSQNLTLPSDIPSKQQRREISKFLASLKMAYFYCGERRVMVNVYPDEIAIMPEDSGVDEQEIIMQNLMPSSSGVCIFDYNHFTRLAHLNFGNIHKAIKDCGAITVDTGLESIVLTSSYERDGQSFAIRGNINFDMVEEQLRSHR